jgi:tetratricopeptide (TPR) repeat protein
LPLTILKSPKLSVPRGLRLGLAVFVIIICVWGILSALRVGESRWLIQRLKIPRSQSPSETAAQFLDETERAVSKTPESPEAHSNRALILLNTRGLNAALPEYESAVTLRPRDYFLWLELGRARDMADDERGAIVALEQSVRLAPFYAQPRWQLGNVLFRAGRVEEAYRELRRAAASDLTLLPNLIDLVWNATNNDPAAVREIIQPEKASWRIALAKFFITHGKISEGLEQFRAAGGMNENDRRTLQDELLAARRYREAYEVWAYDSGESARTGRLNIIHDGGFESKLSRENSGFGWRLKRDSESLRYSLDRQRSYLGAQSLRLDFNGDSNPGQSLLAQLILVEPGARYRMRFAARAEEMVTGGLPVVSVSEVSGAESKTLATSTPISQNSSDWREYSIDFTATKTTSALLISVQRQNCSSGPCPIFGRLWLDEFAIQKLPE